MGWRRAHRSALASSPGLCKKQNMQRLILDTRAANLRFRTPWRVQLPTAGAWAGMELQPEERLHVYQTDVNNAFYRIRCPAGLEEFFVLPNVEVRHLAAAGVEVGGLGAGREQVLEARARDVGGAPRGDGRRREPRARRVPSP